MRPDTLESEVALSSSADTQPAHFAIHGRTTKAELFGGFRRWSFRLDQLHGCLDFLYVQRLAPRRFPFALAAATPSLIRSEISRLSKCAMAPKTWKMNSPAAEEVSIFSSRLRRSICRPRSIFTVSSSSASDRPSRSSRTTLVSPARA